jgi:hypothetical protein
VNIDDRVIISNAGSAKIVATIAAARTAQQVCDRNLKTAQRSTLFARRRKHPDVNIDDRVIISNAGSAKNVTTIAAARTVQQACDCQQLKSIFDSSVQPRKTQPRLGKRCFGRRDVFFSSFGGRARAARRDTRK